MVKNKEFVVFNYTDGVTASPDTFSTKAEAKTFIKSFRKRFEKQGYYFTSYMTKISPEHIDLEIINSEDIGKALGVKDW